MKKRKLLVIYIITLMGLLSACGLLEKNCKVDGCDDEIFKENLCKYHYYIKTSEDALKSIIN